MAYGRWLYKEIDTNRGSISLSIYKKNYTGNAIEINALVADSIVISIDGDGITAPIIGSSLSFSIVDTGQIDTSEFFTPDATMYRIDLSRDGTLEWSGYLTPDSYQENLAYRDTINLIARDNLGRLEEFQFLKSKGLQNMETFIGELLSEVGCPQYVNWDVRKVSIAKGKGISEVTDYNDIWVNTELFVEKDYKEIVEMILTGLGCQMRYNGYNNLIITSLSDIPSFPTQSAIFINKSGFKEILPAWKDVTINQDYGLIENFFDGYLTKEQIGSGLTFVPNVQLPDKWTNNSKLSNLLFANPYEWAEGIEDGAEDSMFPALSNAGAAIWKKKLKSSSAPMEVKMYLNNTLRRLRNSTYKGIGNLFCGSDDTKDHILEYELRYQFLVSFVDSTGKERFMTRYGWADLEDDTNAFLESLFTRINFTTSPCKWDDEGTWDQEQEVTISINNLTEDGELRVYIGNVYWGEKNEVPDDVFFGKIRDIRIAYKLDNGELASRLQVSDKHNINGRVELEIGQVPVGKGDYLAYAGGFFDSQGLPLTNFKRYYDDINNYILMELVAREHIHFNKDNYMALSGDMISDSPFSFRNNIVYKGERYALISASLAVISNTLSVTNMLQVTDYEVAELTTINSPLESSSGTKVGSGNREVLQFSNDAGNAKRLYELDFAMDSDDVDNAYAIVDTDRWQEAKRVKVSELGGLFNKAFEVQIDDAGNVIAVIAKANLGARGGIAARYQGDWGDTPVTPTINSLSDINDVTITNPTNGQGLVYRDGVWVNEVISGGSGEYLPLSGGTIYSGAQNPLNIKGSANYASISFTLDNTTYKSYLLYKGGTNWSITSENWGTEHALIHSGNIGNYTLFSRTPVILNPNHNLNDYVSGYYGYSNAYNPSNSYGDNTAVLALQSVRGIDTWQIAFDGNGINNNYGPRIGIRGNFAEQGWTQWFTLATLNSNVASATKLQTARTIWGQSFDGTGNVTAPATMQYLEFANVGSNVIGYIGKGSNSEDTLYIGTYGDSNVHLFSHYISSSLILKPSGNILIGTTTDNGAKLQVAGGIHISRENFYGEYDEGIRIEGASSDWCGVFLGTSSERRGYQDSQWYLLRTNTNSLRIGRGVSSTSYLEINEYGKIGVGKTNQEYELDVEGSIRTTTGNVRVHHTNSDMCLELLHTHSSYSWNYIRQVSNGYEWHIGITSDVGTSSTDGSDWLYRGAYEIRGNGGRGMNGVFVRYNTSSYGKLVVANSSNYETSIGYLNTNYSYYHPVWTVGTNIGDGNITTFGWFFADTEAKAWLTSSGNFYVKGGLTARYASDIRLKENIQTISIEVALQTIMALNPITFKWNSKATELCSWLNGESQGFIAQEYEALIPNSGSEMWGQYRGIDYNRAIPYIVAVEQNHETRIKQLEEELQTLKREYYGR